MRSQSPPTRLGRPLERPWCVSEMASRSFGDGLGSLSFLKLCHSLLFHQSVKPGPPLGDLTHKGSLELSLVSGKRVNPMDERIESFLDDVLALEGEDQNAVRDGVRVALADCEQIFKAQEVNRRMKDRAAHACHALCRAHVLEEIRRRKGTP